ncbi:hypothetical protein ACTXJY_00360 [Corynebacterium casei]|uniref:hypothetical protein n=1 Tax=Corynebacterium casei TaxID=160386 RepID=UPI003FD3F5A1
MSNWTLEKSERKEDSDSPWTVVDPDGSFTDFDTWQDALDFMEEKLEEQDDA